MFFSNRESNIKYIMKLYEIFIPAILPQNHYVCHTQWAKIKPMDIEI